VGLGQLLLDAALGPRSEAGGLGLLRAAGASSRPSICREPAAEPARRTLGVSDNIVAENGAAE
jgi:hypothetical protein